MFYHGSAWLQTDFLGAVSRGADDVSIQADLPQTAVTLRPQRSERVKLPNKRLEAHSDRWGELSRRRKKMKMKAFLETETASQWMLGMV